MKPVEAFGVAVRIIGLLLCLPAPIYVLFSAMTGNSLLLLLGIAMLIVGLYLLSGASALVRFAYSASARRAE